MTHTTRLTAYEAPSLDCKLVPVEVRQSFLAQGQTLRLWNSRVHRWHRRAGK